jgi:transposase
MEKTTHTPSIDARTLPAPTQEHIRIQAVQACRSGKTQTETARLFGVTRRSVNAWVQQAREGSIRSLRARKRGRPQGSAQGLQPWQCAQIVKAVMDHTPDQLKFPFYLWTREAVGELIATRFGVRMSRWTVGRHLKQWGFTPQKPIRRSYEQNPEEVRKWLKTTYPAIWRQAQREGALILWCDEMGMRSDYSAGRCYGKKGETPVVPGTGQRFSCNMISAVANRGEMMFMVFKEKFSARICLRFFRRLIKQAKRKVYVIIDRHPVHRASAVTRWLRRNRQKIRRIYLPAYSPELNPDEILNQDTKRNAVGIKRPHTREEMVKNVRGFLRNRQCERTIVANYFNAKHVKYAAYK